MFELFMKRPLHLRWIFLPWLIALPFLLYHGLYSSEVAKRQLTTQAVITASEPQSHQTYRYTFQVGGRNFSGADSAIDGRPRIGEPIVVYYDPRNPSKNALTSFNERAWTAVGPILFMTIIMTATTLIVWANRKKQISAPAPTGSDVSEEPTQPPTT